LGGGNRDVGDHREMAAISVMLDQPYAAQDSAGPDMRPAHAR